MCGASYVKLLLINMCTGEDCGGDRTVAAQLKLVSHSGAGRPLIILCELR